MVQIKVGAPPPLKGVSVLVPEVPTNGKIGQSRTSLFTQMDMGSCVYA